MIICLFLGSCKSISEEFSCFNSSGCFHLDERCDGTTDCEQGEDEEFCCAEPTFGCYVDVGDRHDSYGGAGRQLIYQCLEPMSRCDEIADCVDQSDEINCKLNYSILKVYHIPVAL